MSASNGGAHIVKLYHVNGDIKVQNMKSLKVSESWWWIPPHCYNIVWYCKLSIRFVDVYVEPYMYVCMDIYRYVCILGMNILPCKFFDNNVTVTNSSSNNNKQPQQKITAVVRPSADSPVLFAKHRKSLKKFLVVAVDPLCQHGQRGESSQALSC